MRSTGRLRADSGEQVSIFTEIVLSDLEKYRQVEPDKPEAGGILLGTLSSNYSTMFVENISHPLDTDKRERYKFFRSKKHNTIAEHYWRSRNKTGTYHGLWHTHPEPIPSPSSVDLVDWGKALKTDHYYSNRLIFVIVGWRVLSLWSGSMKQGIQPIGLLYWEDMHVENNNSNRNQARSLDSCSWTM